MRHYQKIALVLLFLLNIQSVLNAQSYYNMDIVGRFNPDFPVLDDMYNSACWGYTAPDNREYAILGSFKGTYFYDVTDVKNILQVGFIPAFAPGFWNNWREMKTYSHYAYIVSENGGFQIVDLQYLPDSVRYVGNYVIPGHFTTHTISQSGPYLYLNGCNSSFGNGVAVLDLTINPEQPLLRGKWNNLYIHDSRIVNDTIWACNIRNNSVSVIDATNKDSLVTVTEWQNLPLPAAPHNIALTTDRKFAFVTDETANQNPGRLKIWNVQDLNNILFIGSWFPTNFETSVVHNVEIYDTLAVIACYTAGIRVLNIKDPQNIYEIAYYDTYPKNNVTDFFGCWGVYKFPSGTIIGSDRRHGLFVLRFQSTMPSTPGADFEAYKDTIYYMSGDTTFLFDFSSGHPTGWNWTVNGPQNFTSIANNPKFMLTELGDYTVKLRVNNSLGADSLTKIKYIHVTPPALKVFRFELTSLQTIYVGPSDTSKITYKWNSSIINPLISYKVVINKLSDTSFVWFDSDNGGFDTSITLRKSQLDSLAGNLGVNFNDSGFFRCNVYAYNGIDSLRAENFLTVKIVRTTVGINPISNEIPNVFKLENNYPNPFNPETNIRYQLPKAAFVSIKLYDITGREVRTLVNERHDAGYYNYKFNANGLSSGVYFYKIQAGEFSDIKRMVLIK